MPYLSPFLFDFAIHVPRHVRARRVRRFFREHIVDLMWDPRRRSSGSTSVRCRARLTREAARRAELDGDPAQR